MQAVAVISYFHRKIGPMVYFAYPQTILSKEDRTHLADIMDQSYEEGFYTNKFGELYSINYYFEIYSDWARGNKEMLMISFVLDITPSEKIEAMIKKYCQNFIEKMKKSREIFKAFYKNDDKNVKEDDIQKMKEFKKDLGYWIKELYWTGIEGLRERTEEEKWASIMARREVFEVIKKLSRGPLSMEDLKKWFQSKFRQLDFSKILGLLEQEKFIFINTIVQETFVLLVKEVAIMRIPPLCAIDLEEDSPELADLSDFYIDEVREFFESYQPTPMDSLVLFKLFANPQIYNVIAQLRKGPLAKEKLLSMVSDDTREDLLNSIEVLQQNHIIQSFYYGDVYLYLLKSDVVLTANFPEYLKRLLPKKSKDVKMQTSNSENIKSRPQEEIDLPFSLLEESLGLPIPERKYHEQNVKEDIITEEGQKENQDIDEKAQHQDFIKEEEDVKKYISKIQKDLLNSF